MARVPKKYRRGRKRLLVRAADGSYWLDRPYNSGGTAGRVSTNYRPVRNLRQALRWALRIGRAHGQVEIIRRFFSGKRKRVEMVYLFNPAATQPTSRGVGYDEAQPSPH